ncbi:MAG: hypothetical protein M3Z23_02770 [Acidobacteriota bacterium]|nr:hypothetical protein [Acidobacteriota bacterium]
MARTVYLFLLPFVIQTPAAASGHGPVFALATPTNPKGGWSFDTSIMGRASSLESGAMMRGLLGYGITENLKISVSAPILFKSEDLPPSRVSAFTPMRSDFESLLTWRFHRKDTGVGSRVESAVIGGLLVPGPQESGGALRGIARAPGGYLGAVSGLASRSHYLWGGGSYQRYAEAKGDRRPGLFTYNLVYGYRPQSWRTDYPRWDWRVFGEVAGERAGTRGIELDASQTHQLFVGPSTLGIYKNYAISGGIQFPVYRAVSRNAFSSIYPRERFRVVIDLAYFF